MVTNVKLLVVVVLALCSAVAQSAPFPEKPVLLVVPFGAGAGTDALARFFAQGLADKWKQSVIVENRPGAEGLLGSASVAQAPADGYTLLWTTQSFAINPAVRRNMPYDTLKAFAPITQAAATPYVLAAGSKLKANTMTELIRFAVDNPDMASFGTPEPGGRMVGELLRATANVKMVNVSYKGSAQILNDLAGGHIELGVVSLPSAQALYKAGRVRLLAVTTAERSPQAPEIPAIVESGVKDFDITVWWGLLAPAGTPPAIVDQIYNDLLQVADRGDFRQQVMQRGAVPVLSSPKAFSEFLAADVARAARIARQAGMKLE